MPQVERVPFSRRQEAREALNRFFSNQFDGVMLQELGAIVRPIRRIVGETEWQPIWETSLGNELGRAKYDLIEEAYFWHFDDDVLCEHGPRFRTIQGSMRVAEEYF